MTKLEAVLEVWAGELAQALEMMTGQTFRLSWNSSTDLADCDSWWVQPFSGGGGLSLSIGATKAASNQIGTYVLRSAGVETADEAEIHSTWLELLQQSLSGTARILSSRAASTVECTGGRTTDAAPHADQHWTVQLQGDEFGVELVAAISGALKPGATVVPAAVQSLSPPGTATSDIVPGALPPARTIDALLDIQLPVSISFGRAGLPLKEVLKLASGSVIELDRLPEDPVDILVNDVVIARGEVVVVDGNYAVRISEISSRQQRFGLSAAGAVGGRR